MRCAANKDTPLPDAKTRKAVHDAAAYIRGLAELRGRNAQWAERAVREAVSLSAQEALQLKVIDVVAEDVADLLRQIHGRKVNVAGLDVILNTAGLTQVRAEPDWRSRLLAVIGDPSIAILLLLGIYGLLDEYPIRHRAMRVGECRLGREQLGLKPGICKIALQRPSDSGFHKAPHIIGNGASGYLDALGDLPFRQVKLKLQSQCFSNFTH